MLDDVINQQKVLECFDGKKMWNTLLNMTKSNFVCGNSFYNPEIVLRVLANAVKPGFELQCKEFVKMNALSFAFVGTSLEDETLRALSYTILSRFLGKLKDLTDEVFTARLHYTFLINLFKHSIEEKNQRICHAVSHFFARVSKLILVPSDAAYPPIMAFLALKPTISLRTVPEFLKLFFSTSTEHFNDERFWILRLCSNTMIEPRDYEVLNSAHVIESCQSLFLSTMGQLKVKAEILYLFTNCVQFESVALDLFYRFNFTTWLAQAIQHPFTVDNEEVKLVDLFLKVVEHVYNFYTTSADSMESKRRRRRAKAIDDEYSLGLFTALIKVNAEKLLKRLQSLENAKQGERIEKLTRVCSKEWRLASSS